MGSAINLTGGESAIIGESIALVRNGTTLSPALAIIPVMEMDLCKGISLGLKSQDMTSIKDLICIW